MYSTSLKKKVFFIDLEGILTSEMPPKMRIPPTAYLTDYHLTST